VLLLGRFAEAILDFDEGTDRDTFGQVLRRPEK